MAMLQNVSGVSNTGIDLLAEYDYSMEDSGAVYLAFIAEQGYVTARV